MKNRLKNAALLCTGIVLGATLFGGVAASAASGVMAERSVQTVYVDGQRVELEAYLIDGANYVKLRDVGQATNAINVYWDGSAVQIQSGVPYTGEGTSGAAAQPEPSVEASSVTDHSAAANPEIFSGIYTREAYNAAYEVLTAARTGDFSKTAKVYFEDYHDRQKFEILLADLANGTTLSMRACGNGIYEIYAIKVDHDMADMATAELLREARQLSTDREKVILLNEWICDHMIYNSKVVVGVNEITAATEPVEGNCTSYARLMNYLCRRLSIPCIMVFGESHCWNMIYTDGAWSYTDVSYNDLVYDHAGILFDDTAPKQPSNPDGDHFLMELLVPGSTK